MSKLFANSRRALLGTALVAGAVVATTATVAAQPGNINRPAVIAAPGSFAYSDGVDGYLRGEGTVMMITAGDGKSEFKHDIDITNLAGKGYVFASVETAYDPGTNKGEGWLAESNGVSPGVTNKLRWTFTTSPTTSSRIRLCWAKQNVLGDSGSRCTDFVLHSEA